MERDAIEAEARRHEVRAAAAHARELRERSAELIEISHSLRARANALKRQLPSCTDTDARPSDGATKPGFPARRNRAPSGPRASLTAGDALRRLVFGDGGRAPVASCRVRAWATVAAARAVGAPDY